MAELHDGQILKGGGRVDMIDSHPVVFIPLTRTENDWAFRKPVDILHSSVEVVLPPELPQDEITEQ